MVAGCGQSYYDLTQCTQGKIVGGKDELRIGKIVGGKLGFLFNPTTYRKSLGPRNGLQTIPNFVNFPYWIRPRVIFMEDHIPLRPDRSLLMGRQTSKWKKK